MLLREDQKERLLEYFFNSDVAYLVEFIMENTYDSMLEDLANELLGDEEETAELEEKYDTN
jgi:hypothetical protein